MHCGIPGKKARHDRHRATITIESVGVHISWGPRYNRKNRFVGVLQELPAWRSSRQVRFHRGSGLLLFSSPRDYGFLPPLPWRPPTTWSSIPAEGIGEIASPKAKRRTKNGEKHARIYAHAPTRSAFLLQACLHDSAERFPQRVRDFISKLLRYLRRSDRNKKVGGFIKLNGVSEEMRTEFQKLLEKKKHDEDKNIDKTNQRSLNFQVVAVFRTFYV